MARRVATITVTLYADDLPQVSTARRARVPKDEVGKLNADRSEMDRDQSVACATACDAIEAAVRRTAPGALIVVNDIWHVRRRLEVARG